MSNLIQLRVCAGTDSWLILMSQSAKVDELSNVITTKYVSGIEPSKLCLLFGDKYLEYGNEKCLKDYGLAHLSKIEVRGDISAYQWIRKRRTSLVPLPEFITVTSSDTEPDMITLDHLTDKKRARMPCGHIIGPISMTMYCRSILTDGKFKFYCPAVDEAGKGNCNSEWEYFLVRHVACLSLDEMNEFEKKISDNYLQKAKGFQTCPGCGAWCYKGDVIGNNVRCSQCNKNFCWACLRGWIGPGHAPSCGNSDCDGRDRRTGVLAKCSPKVIGGCSACPSMRVCPKCGTLAEHKDACAHVYCPSCKHGFCFICLKGKTSSGRWPCPPAGTCVLAPRQTSTSWSAPASQPESQTSTPSPAPASESESSWCTII